MGQQTKANPYPNGNFALMLDFLEELISIAGKEKGLIAIADSEKGYEDVFFKGSEVKGLDYPDHAVSATIMVELLSNESSVSSVLVRFKENGSPPTQDSGFGLGHQDVFEVNGKVNLANFRVLRLSEDIALRVQYYRSGKNIAS